MDDHLHFELAAIFDDDGNYISPQSIPKPSLCVVCSVDTCTHPIETIVCTLVRLDHMVCEEPKEFICHKFTPKEDRGN